MDLLPLICRDSQQFPVLLFQWERFCNREAFPVLERRFSSNIRSENWQCIYLRTLMQTADPRINLFMERNSFI